MKTIHTEAIKVIDIVITKMMFGEMPKGKALKQIREVINVCKTGQFQTGIEPNPDWEELEVYFEAQRQADISTETKPNKSKASSK